MDYKNIVKRLYRNRIYKEHKKLGLCVRCSRKNDKGSIYCEYHRALHKKRLKNAYYKCIKKNICTLCRKRKADYPHTQCKICKQHKNKDAYQKIKKRLIAENRCVRCGSPKNNDSDMGYVCCINCRERNLRRRS